MNKLTVDEYAKLKGISKQAVYKKINKLNTTEEKRNGKTITIILLEDEDLQEFTPEENQPNSTATNSTVENCDNKPKSATSTATNSTVENQPNSTVEINRHLIELLEKQLKEKDKQIEQLLKTNAEQSARFSELLYRSQQLEAQIHLLLPDKSKEKEQDNNDVVEVKTTEDDSQEKKKKGFFQRLFGKNN